MTALAHAAIRADLHEPCPFCGCERTETRYQRRISRGPKIAYLGACEPVGSLCWRWDHYHARPKAPRVFIGSGYRAATWRGREIPQTELANAWREYDARTGAAA